MTLIHRYCTTHGSSVLPACIVFSYKPAYQCRVQLYQSAAAIGSKVNNRFVITCSEFCLTVLTPCDHHSLLLYPVALPEFGEREHESTRK